MQNAQETVTSARPTDEVDPELLALPAPPRGKRLVAMTVMAFTVAASGLLLASLAPDIGYYFASSQSHDLGDATGVSAATLEPNTYVRVRGTPMASGMVRYHRLFGGDYVVFPLAGQEQLLMPDAGELADIAERYGTPGGHVYDGELALDQLWLQRPSLALGRYATPITGLFLGGSGSHPGGPFRGGAGILAAKAVLARE